MQDGLYYGKENSDFVYFCFCYFIFIWKLSMTQGDVMGVKMTRSRLLMANPGCQLNWIN